MSCQQVPTAPAFNPYPRSVQVGEFEVAIGGGIWVAIGDGITLQRGALRLIRTAQVIKHPLICGDRVLRHHRRQDC